ncbi:MAG: hypothetical protein ACE37E_01140 [Hyphomicrobiales bacterium]
MTGLDFQARLYGIVRDMAETEGPIGAVVYACRAAGASLAVARDNGVSTDVLETLVENETEKGLTAMMASLEAARNATQKEAG